MTQTHDRRPQILVMDANERNADLLKEFLAAEGYDPVVATDLELADEIISRGSTFSFAIIDVDRFDSPVWPYCEELNEHDVPFIVFSGVRRRSLQRESHEHGASEFIDKPIPKRELRDLIRSTIASHTP